MWPKGRGSNWLARTVDISEDGPWNENDLIYYTHNTNIFSASLRFQTSHWGAFEDWYDMRCVYKKNINFLVTLKHKLCQLLLHKVHKMLFCTRWSNSHVPPTLCELDFKIIDNNWAVFFDLDTSQGRNTSMHTNSISWPWNRLVIPT